MLNSQSYSFGSFFLYPFSPYTLPCDASLGVERRKKIILYPFVPQNLEAQNDQFILRGASVINHSKNNMVSGSSKFYCTHPSLSAKLAKYGQLTISLTLKFKL